jgi:hypothetical protein
MRAVAAALSSAIVVVAVAFLATPGRADDRELQAILLKSACVPAKVVSTRLSATLTAYEVTCKRSGKIIHVVCRESDCTLQKRPAEDDER